MKEFGSYFIVLLAYLPGIIALWRWKWLWRLPLITFCFLGLFVFNAAGSILVMTRTDYVGTLFSIEYVAMLVTQALIFYLICAPYLRYRSKITLEMTLTRADHMLPFVLATLVGVILWLYYQRVGHFLITDLLSGEMDSTNVLSYRELTYGLPEYKYYRLGFLVLPGILAAHLFLTCSVRGKFDAFRVTAIAMCLIPPLLLAEKAGILHLVAILFIAYTLHASFKEVSLTKVFGLRLLVVLLLAFIPTLFIYSIYYKQFDMTWLGILDHLLFRIVGVYSEALAAIVPFVDIYGELGGTTVPNLKGLLPHDRINLEAVMSAYLTHGGLQTEFVGLPASVGVSAAAEGYVNFRMSGFVLFSVVSFGSVILMQELLNRLRLGIFSYSLMVWYAYLTMTISMTSIFATIISLLHTLVLVAAILIFLIVSAICKRLAPTVSGLRVARQLRRPMEE